jgi:hypothetical protein
MIVFFQQEEQPLGGQGFHFSGPVFAFKSSSGLFEGSSRIKEAKMRSYSPARFTGLFSLNKEEHKKY